jgi:hypothetical protein
VDEKYATRLMLDASWSKNVNEPYVENNMFNHNNTNDQKCLCSNYLLLNFSKAQ